MAQKTVVQRVYTNPLSIIVSILAVMVSWYFNKSILWAIFHYMFGWIYMIYSLLIGRFADGGFMEIINSYL
jgi:hypothetical protein